MHKRIIGVSLIILLSGCVTNARAATPAATQPAGLSAKSSVDDVLDALDARGQGMKDFSTSVKITDSNTASGYSTSSDGTVVLQRKADGDCRIRINFTRKQVGNKIFDVDHEYTLDGGELDDRDYQAKKEDRKQVLQPGQKLDLFKLGEGPFPLPLGQKRQDVEKMFDVQKIAPAGDDPPNTIHLQLTPKPGTQFAPKFKTIDIWVDMANSMPRRIQTLDPNETSTRTTDLTNVKINGSASDRDFDQPPMTGAWDVIDEPMND